MSTGDNHTINVSIVAYRDADLASTLLSLFRASASPGKLVVGVIWQGDEGDAAIAPGSECFSEIANLAPPSRGTDENHGQPYDFTGPGGARYDYELKANGHVLWLTMPSAEAKGPLFARHLCERLLLDYTARTSLYHMSRCTAAHETPAAATHQPFAADAPLFHMQLDSHMRFAAAWDTRALELLELCGQQSASDKVVLSSYGRGCSRDDAPTAWPPAGMDSPEQRAASLCVAEGFDPDGILRLKPRVLRDLLPQPAVRSPFWSGHFSFAKASVSKACPTDAGLASIFYGEEISMAARLFTHGYDVYAPTETLAWHCWSRSYRPLYNDDLPDAKPSAAARDRLEAVLTGAASDASGLGSSRSLAEYEEFAGVSFSARRLDASGRAALGGVDDATLFADAYGFLRMPPPPPAHLLSKASMGASADNGRSCQPSLYRLSACDEIVTASLFSRLAGSGYASFSCADLLPTPAAVASDLAALMAAHSLGPALGNIDSLGVIGDGMPIPKVRDDMCCWPDLAGCDLAGYHALSRSVRLLHGVCAALDEKSGRDALSMSETPMLARYEIGGRYRRHADNPNKTSNSRRYTVILYLNDAYAPGKDGGELRLYPSGFRGADPPVDVLPCLGTVVVFRSELLHEVMRCATRKGRWALTAWMCDASS